MKDLKGLIIGCGSIGERHIFNLKKLGIENITVFDFSKKRLQLIAKKYKIKSFSNINSALSYEPNFSIISTFPQSHILFAIKCIENKSHVFIEKPISSSIFSVQKMLNLAKKKRVNVSVGYNLRFEKGLGQMKKFLKTNKIGSPLSIHAEWGQNIRHWKPGTDYKKHYVLKKDGGIILDDSHEYDYLRWLLDDEPYSIYCQTRKASSFKTESESLATLSIKFRKGALATLIIDYVRPFYKRQCNIVGEQGSLTWDFIPQKNIWKNYTTTAKSNISFALIGQKNIKKITNVITVNDMYLKEMKNFLNSIIHKEKLRVDGVDGLKTLKIGLAAKESAIKNKVIKINY